jgi:hypothetical protein
MINSVYIREKALINLMALHNQNNEAPDVKRVMKISENYKDL